MASQIETAGKNTALDTIGTTYGYMALFSDAGTTEITGGSYARQPITWSSASNGIKNIASNVSFTGLPTCTITHVALYSAVSGGTRGAIDDVTSETFASSGGTYTVTGYTITLT